jgi:mannose-1-phosphate guanylyltransferase
MPIGARPVLELLLKSLRRHGLEEIYITTGYLGHLIQSFCGDGSQWGMKIRYTIEKEPLGTVGALSLLRDQLDSTFLMLNGDVLTDLDIRGFTSSHRKKRSLLTVAMTARTTRLDYGVIDETDGQVTRFREKPTLSHLVSMGVYCIEPKLLSYIPLGTPFGFDDLVYCLMEKRVPIHTFMHKGFWMDIGRIEDFKKAQEMDLDNELGAARDWEFLNDVECV